MQRPPHFVKNNKSRWLAPQPWVSWPATPMRSIEFYEIWTYRSKRVTFGGMALAGTETPFSRVGGRKPTHRPAALRRILEAVRRQKSRVTLSVLSAVAARGAWQQLGAVLDSGRISLNATEVEGQDAAAIVESDDAEVRVLEPGQRVDEESAVTGGRWSHDAA